MEKSKGKKDHQAYRCYLMFQFLSFSQIPIQADIHFRVLSHVCLLFIMFYLLLCSFFHPEIVQIVSVFSLALIFIFSQYSAY